MSAKLNSFRLSHRFPKANWWLGHQEELICYDPATGRVRALIGHDGRGQYSRTLFASLWIALKLLRSGAVVSTNLHAFPLCIVDLPGIQCTDILAAKTAVEDLMAEVGLTDGEDC